MKHKARVTVTAIVEYEINPENYPESIRHDPQLMLKEDLRAAEEDVFLFIDGTNTKWLPITGEVSL